MRKYLCFVCVAHGQQTHPERSTPTAPFNICPICHLAICSAHSATLCRDGHERESEFQADQRSQADHARNSGCQNVQKIGAAQEDELNDLDVDATTRLGEQIRGFKIVEEGTIAWDMKPLQPVPWWAAKLRAEMERSLDQFETWALRCAITIKSRPIRVEEAINGAQVAPSILEGMSLLHAHVSVTILCSLVSIASASGLWHVSIDEGPAPSPEDGPPFSAHATRNPALLKAQICGIIGSYVGFAFIVGILLATVGKRMRHRAQSSHSSRGMELVKPANRVFEASPISPNSTQRPWYSPRRQKTKPGSVRSGSGPASPVPESLASFDATVIQSDKLARQQEMERLYAAVMSQNEDGKPEPLTSEIELRDMSQHTTVHVANRRPPRLITTAPALQHLRTHADDPSSPASPRSPVRAIYPPDAVIPQGPASPTSPIRADYSAYYPKTPTSPTYSAQYPKTPTSPVYAAQYPPNLHGRAGQMALDNPTSQPSRASSVGSEFSGSSKPKKMRRSLRHLKISPPNQKYPGEEDSDSARTPLTPRYYAGPGQPPSPPARSEAPTTPATYNSRDRDLDDESEYGNSHQPLPRSASRRHGGNEYKQPASSSESRSVRVSLPSSPRAYKSSPPPKQSASNPYGSAASNISNGTLGSLPFRDMHPPAALRSPGLQTTYLDRRRDMLGVPRTGMATPYSPYMPFTPITPVTPHLTSRAERRQRERDEGRRVMGQEDAVIDEDKMWGTAL
ncbi:hypothetical protein MBLNU457_6942t1 [Dothideomycetes sp. NU457]